jgi:hypothetical protein
MLEHLRHTHKAALCMHTLDAFSSQCIAEYLVLGYYRSMEQHW